MQTRTTASVAHSRGRQRVLSIIGLYVDLASVHWKADPFSARIEVTPRLPIQHDAFQRSLLGVAQTQMEMRRPDTRRCLHCCLDTALVRERLYLERHLSKIGWSTAHCDPFAVLEPCPRGSTG